MVDINSFVLYWVQHAVSTDPTEQPEIDPHVFEDDFGDYNTLLLKNQQMPYSDIARPVDFQCLLEVVKFNRNLRNVKPLSGILGARLCLLRVTIVLNSLLTSR